MQILVGLSPPNPYSFIPKDYGSNDHRSQSEDVQSSSILIDISNEQS